MNKLTERMFEINNRKAEIRSAIEANKDADIDAFETELNGLNEEFASIEKRMKLVDGITVEKTKEENNMENTYTIDSKEYRSAWLKTLQGVKLDEVEQRAISTTSGAAVIPTQTADQIMSKLQQVAPLLKEITLLTVAGNVTFASEGVRDSASIHAENADVASAGDTIVNVSLGGYEFIKVIRVSKTVATMAVNAFETWLVNLLSEDIGRKIESYIISGTGVSQPTGVEKANTWDATNSVTVAAASSLTYANVTALIGLLKGGYDYNAKFLMSKKTLFSDVYPLKDSNKLDLVTRDSNGYMILGYPVMLSDAVAEHDIYLGDFKKMVGNLSQDITVESNVNSGFTANAIDFRGTAIFDCKPAVGEAFVKATKAQA